MATETVLNGTYTIVNPKTGGYRTLRIDDADRDFFTSVQDGTRVASYLMGPDNGKDFKGFAFVFPGGRIAVWKKYHNATDIQAALRWLLTKGVGREAELAKAYALRSGRCGFCVRELTVPESIANGYGPVCAEKNGLPYERNV